MTNKQLLLCTDLDRTLLPNGSQAETPGSRQKFCELVEQEHIRLVYVTGRHQHLVEQAINNFKIPIPDFVITDVGTRIFDLRSGEWQAWEQWEEAIDADWNGKNYVDLHKLLGDLPDLRMQEFSKQNKHKLSYYVPLKLKQQEISEEIQQRLVAAQVKTNQVWSIDEPASIGLLDILPASAGKLQSIEFLRKKLGHDTRDTLFSGDSGNDIPVLASKIPSILVGNAAEDVRKIAIDTAQNNSTQEFLYLAKNNYSAGIIEGLLHYHPEATHRKTNKFHS